MHALMRQLVASYEVILLVAYAIAANSAALENRAAAALIATMSLYIVCPWSWQIGNAAAAIGAIVVAYFMRSPLGFEYGRYTIFVCGCSVSVVSLLAAAPRVWSYFSQLQFLA